MIWQIRRLASGVDDKVVAVMKEKKSARIGQVETATAEVP